MEHIQITDELGVWTVDDIIVLAIRDRESKGERLVCCALNKEEVDKLIKELRS